MRKRPFRGTSKPRLFFDRKVRKQGSTRSLSISKVLPSKWAFVRLEVMEQDASKVTLKITKLLGEDELAPTVTVNKGRKQIA